MNFPKLSFGKSVWKAGSQDLQHILDQWLENPDPFDNQILSQSAYRRVVKLTAPSLDSPVVIKEFLPARSRPTFAKRLIAHAKRLPRVNAAQREWDALKKLEAANVPVASPLALAERPGGGALLVTRHVGGGKTLGESLHGYAFEQRRLLRRVGELVRQLHESGYLHGDLHIGNILIGEKGPVLVDLQRVREIKDSGDRIRDLAFLDFSLYHLGVTRSNRLRFRIAALGIGLFRVAEEREQLRIIGRASHTRGIEYYNGRTRRTLRTGEDFFALSIERWKGLRHSEFSEAAAAAAIDMHRREVSKGGPAVIKSDHRSQVSSVDLDGRRVIVKQVVKTSLPKQVADVFRGSSARRAWVGGHGLRIRGFAAPMPLAFLEERKFGVPVASIVVLEDISELQRVSDVKAGTPLAHALPRVLQRLVTRLHRSCIVHGDFQSIHVYLDEQTGEATPTLIDLEGVRFPQEISDGKRIEMLAALNASIADEVIPAEERAEMFERHARALPYEQGNNRAARLIVRRSLARDQRWKGTNCDVSRRSG